MTKHEKGEVGIRYEVLKINDTMFLLSPLNLTEGYSIGDIFYSTDVEKTLYNPESLNESILVDSITSLENLSCIYDFDDLDFIKEFYLTEEKDFIIIVEVKDGRLFKRKINIQKLVKNESSATYERQKDEPTVTLNCDALEEILNSATTQEVREKLEKYRKLLQTFRDKEKKDSITAITVNNGHVTNVQLNRKVEGQTKGTISTQTASRPENISDFTVRGLEQYLKERIFGHDQELRQIATKLIMNYRSKPEYGTESILIVGPTGTGKTETIRAASEYFNLPFVAVNTANLVPQGIKGPSLKTIYMP